MLHPIFILNSTSILQMHLRGRRHRQKKKKDLYLLAKQAQQLKTDKAR